MNETVLVTLRTKGFSQDFELPCNVKLSELYPRLMAVLKEMKGGLFDDCAEVILEAGGCSMTDGLATLGDYRICTGCVLDIVRKEEKLWRLKKNGC